MINFKTALIAGYCVENDIHEFIEEWHFSKLKIELHEFLGLTFQEYKIWAETGKVVLLSQ